MTAFKAQSEPIYLDVYKVSHRYGISDRHWMRMVEAGEAPRPSKFGRLNRWSIESLNLWEQSLELAVAHEFNANEQGRSPLAKVTTSKTMHVNNDSRHALNATSPEKSAS